MKKDIKKGYCRPYKRVTKKTPRTAKELSRNLLKKRALKKRKNPNKTIN